MTNSSTVKKIVYLAILIVILVLAMVYLGKVFNRGSATSKGLSPNILDLTLPVYSFGGVIERIDKNILTVKFMPNTDAVKNSEGSRPSPNSREIVYKVTVDSKTEIYQEGPAVPYLFKPEDRNTNSRTVADLKAGQKIVVTSNEDLRMVSDSFGAKYVVIEGGEKILPGKIDQVENGQLKIMALNNTYMVKVTDDSEISHLNYDNSQSPKPQKFKLEELKPGTEVMVYTDQDIASSQNLTALRIDPRLATNNESSTSAKTKTSSPTSPAN